MMCEWSEREAEVSTTARNCGTSLHKINFKANYWNPCPESYIPCDCVHADFSDAFVSL